MLDQPDRLAAAGMTWEALAGWLQGPLDAAAWEALIPSMGYMALLRNLRNFDQAGVPDEVAEQVAARLADPAQVARSRQLPMRFLSAYRAAPSLRWACGAGAGAAGIAGERPGAAGPDAGAGRPVRLDVRTAVARGRELTRADAAAVFGAALAVRASGRDLVRVRYRQRRRCASGPGESVLRVVDRFGGPRRHQHRGRGRGVTTAATTGS